MNYIGDFKTGQDIVFFFSTNDKNGGSVHPTINEGDIKVYKDGGAASEISVDTFYDTFDSLIGIHRITLDVSSHSEFYTASHDFAVILTTSTIDGETVRAVLAEFSIENRFSSGELYKKAAKVLVNKAIQNKSSGAVVYYDDDGETPMLTHTPADSDTEITRTPS